MTPAEHDAQRDAVRLSELMQTSRSDRRDMPRRKPTVVTVVTQRGAPLTPAHVYVVPVVTENERLL